MTKKRQVNDTDKTLSELMIERLASGISEKHESAWPDVYINSSTKKKYTPHNKEEETFVKSDEPRYFLCKGGEGDLKLDTPVSTPAGFTTVAEISVGDDLFDEQGNICQVTSKSQVFTDKTCYRLRFDIGGFVDCSEDHLWVVGDIGKPHASITTDEMYHVICTSNTPFYIKLPKNHLSKRHYTEILDVERIETVSTQCISVNSPNRMFLCGENNIPTHNSGKMLHVDTLVPTPDGYTKMGKIDVGDVVFDENGNRCNVTSRSGIFLRDDAFNILLDTGETLTACADHQWFVFDGMSFSIYTTREMYGAMYSKGDGLSFSIPLSRPIGIDDDDSTRKYGGSISKRYISPFLLREPYSVRVDFLKRFWEQHIDIDRNGRGRFIFDSEEQSLIFFELLNTLSIKTNLPIESKLLKERYVIEDLPAEFPEIPTAFPTESKKLILSIKPNNGVVPMQCISVDSPNRLYLVDRGHTVTHNSVAGIIKTLNKLRRGMSGALLGPNLPHFKKSIWPEFIKWVPEQIVIPEHRYKINPRWDGMNSFFNMLFVSDVGKVVSLYCGGIDNPGAWEGPTLNFVHLDEAQVLRTSEALEVLAGRIRLPGPKGEPPQLYITSVPAKNWLMDFFGPKIEDDPHEEFKSKSKVITLKTRDNILNLDSDYVAARSATLSETERLRRMEAEWVDKESGQKFIPNMILWDKLFDKRWEVQKIDKTFPMVLAVDAGVSGDYFVIVGVSRNPDKDKSDTHVVVRYTKVWKPSDSETNRIDFMGNANNPGPEMVLRELCKQGNVVIVTYDPYQLHDMANRLYNEAVAWFSPFTQNAQRDLSDKLLYDLIIQERVHHGGDKDLRKHLDNADKKNSEDNHKLRIIKRQPSLKIDLAVALSMACFTCLKLNL